MNISVPFGDVPRTRLLAAKDCQKLIPSGWQALCAEAWGTLRTFERTGPEWEVWYKIEKGLLRFEIVSEWTTELDRKLINRICQSIASSSAQICMECGKHGFRRKNEVGWPCLCSTHYIEYATQLSNQENG